jgi:hypothetical protein
MSTLNVDKVDPQSGTALEIGTSGDTVTIPTGAGLTVTDEVKTNKVSPATGTAFSLGDSGDTFTMPSGATLDISASTLTPPTTMPASSGINLTALNATNLGSGTVPTARLGTGTASSSTILYGDNTWAAAAAGGGKILQIQNTHFTSGGTVNTSTSFASTYITDQITPAATSSKILIQMQFRFYPYRETTTANNATGLMALYRDIGGAGFTKVWAASGGADLGIGVGAGTIGGDNATWMDVNFSQPLIFLDSPNTTSACDYTLYIAKVGTMNNMQVGNSSHVADVVLTEIGA